jgi:hypothetical protein
MSHLEMPQLQMSHLAFELCRDMKAVIRLTNTDAIYDKRKKRPKPHLGKLITLTDGCISESTGSGPHPVLKRVLVPISEGEYFLGTDGTQIFSIDDIRRQFKPLLKEHKTGLFDIPLMMRMESDIMSTFSVDQFEIVSYVD